MGKESRIFATYDEAKKYEAFGYEAVQIFQNGVLTTREGSRECYRALCNYEAEYEAALSEFTKLVKPVKHKTNMFKVIILFICLIVPGIIYLYKGKKKEKEYTQKLEEYQKKYDQFLNKINDVYQRSKNLALMSK